MVWIFQFIHVYLWTEFNTLSRSTSGLINFFSFVDNKSKLSTISIGCVDFYLNRNLIKTVVVFFS